MLEPWDPPPPRHDHSRVGCPDWTQWCRRDVDLEDASNNTRRDGRVSKLDAHDSVLIPPQRLFCRDSSGRFGNDLRVIWRVVSVKQNYSLTITTYKNRTRLISISKYGIVVNVSPGRLDMLMIQPLKIFFGNAFGNLG